MRDNKARLITLALVFGLSAWLVGYSAIGVKHQFGKRQFSDLEFNHMSHSGDIARGDDGKLVYVPDQTGEAEAATVAAANTASSGAGAKANAASTTKKTTVKPAVKGKAPAAPKSNAQKPAGEPAKGKKKPACPT